MVEIEENQLKAQEKPNSKKSCETCQGEAEKKCSRCEVVFYCCRWVWTFIAQLSPFAKSSVCVSVNVRSKIGSTTKRSAISMFHKTCMQINSNVHLARIIIIHRRRKSIFDAAHVDAQLSRNQHYANFHLIAMKSARIFHFCLSFCSVETNLHSE